MTRDAKSIVRAAASVFSAGWVHEPQHLREAAAHIRTNAFTAEDDERELVNAIADLFERRAEAREKTYREVFGGRS